MWRLGHSTPFHSVPVHHRWAQPQGNQQCSWMMLIYAFHFACQSLNLHFTNITLSKCSRAHVVPFIQLCGFLMQCCLRGQRSQTFNVGFQPCSSHAEISPDSLILLMILLILDGEIPKFLQFALRKVLFNYLPTQFFTKWWTLPCHRWCTIEPVEEASLIPNHLLTIHLFTCAAFHHFPSLFWPPS